MITFKGFAAALALGSISLPALAMTQDHSTEEKQVDEGGAAGSASVEGSPSPAPALASTQVTFSIPHPDYTTLAIEVTGATPEAALQNLLEQIRWMGAPSRQKVWESLAPILEAQQVPKDGLWWTQQLVLGKIKPTSKTEIRADLKDLVWKLPYEQREGHPLMRPISAAPDCLANTGLIFSPQPARHATSYNPDLTGITAILALGSPFDHMRAHPYSYIRRGLEVRQALQWNQDFPMVFSTAIHESRMFRPGYFLTLPSLEDSYQTEVTTFAPTPWKAVRASLSSLKDYWSGLPHEKQLWVIQHFTNFLECTLPHNRASSQKVWEDWILNISALGHDEQALYLAHRQVKEDWNPRAGLAGLILAQHRAKRADLAKVYPILSHVALALGDEETAWRAHEADWRMRHHHRNLFPELDLYAIEEGIARTFALNPDYVDPELGILYAFTLGGAENIAKGRAYFAQALEKMEARDRHFNNKNAESMFWLDSPNAVRLFIAAIDLLWNTREAYGKHPQFKAVVQDRVETWEKIAAAQKAGSGKSMYVPIPSEDNITHFVAEGVDAFKHLLCLSPGMAEGPALLEARATLIGRLCSPDSADIATEIHRVTQQLQVITPRNEKDFINYAWLMRGACHNIFEESTAHVVADLIVPREHSLAMRLYKVAADQDIDSDAAYAIGDFQHEHVVRSSATRHAFLPEGWEGLI